VSLLKQALARRFPRTRPIFELNGERGRGGLRASLAATTEGAKSGGANLRIELGAHRLAVVDVGMALEAVERARDMEMDLALVSPTASERRPAIDWHVCGRPRFAGSPLTRQGHQHSSVLSFLSGSLMHCWMRETHAFRFVTP
jgi:hypothetical protein